jgi:hypothetical protein
VNFVGKFLQKINIKKAPVVLPNVGVNCHGKRVIGVQYVGKEDVYCMDVPESECFIANGMVVHNCLDSVRYAIYSHMFAKEGNRLTAKDIDRNYRESQGNTIVDLPRELTMPDEEWSGF